MALQRQTVGLALAAPSETTSHSYTCTCIRGGEFQAVLERKAIHPLAKEGSRTEGCRCMHVHPDVARSMSIADSSLLTSRNMPLSWCTYSTSSRCVGWSRTASVASLTNRHRHGKGSLLLARLLHAATVLADSGATRSQGPPKWSRKEVLILALRDASNSTISTGTRPTRLLASGS
jgi:hypothetical protein